MRANFTRDSWQSPEAQPDATPSSGVGQALSQIGSAARSAANLMVEAQNERVDRQTYAQFMGSKAVMDFILSGTVDPAVIGWLLTENGWQEWLDALDSLYRSDTLRAIDDSNLFDLVVYLLENPAFVIPADSPLDRLEDRGRALLDEARQHADDGLHFLEEWWSSRIARATDMYGTWSDNLGIDERVGDAIRSTAEPLTDFFVTRPAAFADRFLHGPPTYDGNVYVMPRNVVRDQPKRNVQSAGGGGASSANAGCRRDKRGHWICPPRKTRNN